MTLILDGFQLAVCGGMVFFFVTAWVIALLIHEAWEIVPRRRKGE
jgi:hypothetical protein